MKRIGITQRVAYMAEIQERRDCLDQRWSSLMLSLGYLPVPLSNIAPEHVASYIKNLDLHALMLSGGNSLASLDPNAKDAALERDDFECALLDHAFANDIPVVGICRGMQLLNVYFDGSLAPVKNHVAIDHSIRILDNSFDLPESVNSYHNWGISREGLSKHLSAIAVDEDDYVEAFHHAKKRVLGLMWHPERETPFNQLDLKLLEGFLK